MMQNRLSLQPQSVTGRLHEHAAQSPVASSRIDELTSIRRPAVGGRQDNVDGISLRVLVVDCRAAILEVVAMMFKALGCSVSIAHGAQAAVNTLSNMPFDLVVSEFSLSKLNGCQLAALVKARFPQTRVLIMTGMCQSEVAVDMGSPHVDGWIFKPFGFTELLGVLDLIKYPQVCQCFRA